MADPIKIAGRLIGAGHPPYMVAELSSNHLGDLARARDLIGAAARAGADAVKIQLYAPEDMTLDSRAPGFVVESGPWAGRTLYDLYREAQTPVAWLADLLAHASACGITLFATPFSASAAQHMAALNVPAFKIASFEAVDLPLIEDVARHGKPVIISTGMCDHDEIARALSAARKAGAREIALLHCTSAYPAPVDEADLLAIPMREDLFGVPVGYSDHTRGAVCAIAAAALGAAIIEKHFTLSRAQGGTDAAFSLEPEEFAALVRDCRHAAMARGKPRTRAAACETANLQYRRSLFAVADISSGTIIDRSMVRALRPALGLSPRFLPDIIGRRAQRDIAAGEPLAWEMFGGPPRS